jgi:hypothetical protein
MKRAWLDRLDETSGNQLPYLDGVEYIFAADDTSKSNMMVAGEGDLLASAFGVLTEALKARGFEVTVYINTNLILVPDTAKADSPWSNVKVRPWSTRPAARPWRQPRRC